MTIRRALLRAFAPVIALVVGALAVTAFCSVTADQSVASADVQAENDQVAEMVEHYECWTSEAPAGVIPGHVVYADADGRVSLGGQAETATALDGLFSGDDMGDIVTVYAFCR